MMTGPCFRPSVMFVAGLMVLSCLMGRPASGVSDVLEDGGGPMDHSEVGVPTEVPSERAGGLADTPWPMFHMDPQHTGVSPYDTSSNPGEVRWVYYNYWGFTTSMAIGENDMLYAPAGRDLYAISPIDGSRVWMFGGGWEQIHAPPAINSSGWIFIITQSGYLRGLTPEGKEEWRIYSVINGEAPAIGEDGTIYVVDAGSSLLAIRPPGGVVWEAQLAGWLYEAPAIGLEGTIYVGSRNGRMYAVDPNGSLNWTYDSHSVVRTSASIGSDGTIYFGDEGGNLTALFPNGTLRWNFLTGASVTSTPAIGTDGTIYFGSLDGHLYALYPNGTERWRFSIGDGVSSSPAIGSDGTVFFGGRDHGLYAVYPNGTKRWRIETGDRSYFSPAIDSRGFVYYGSQDGYLYSVGDKNPHLDITYPLEDIYVTNNSVRVTGTANDTRGLVSVEVSIDGENWTMTSGFNDWYSDLTLENGNYTVHARATDDCGNVITRKVNFTVDATLPNIDITTPLDGEFLPKGRVVMRGTAGDNMFMEKVEVSANGTNWTEPIGIYNWTQGLDLLEGGHTLYAKATDKAGNTNTMTINITVDLTPPTIDIMRPFEGEVLGTTSVVVAGSASDNASVHRVEISTDSENWTIATGTTDWYGDVNLTVGPNTIHARAVDFVGLMDVMTVNVTVDDVLPTIVISAPLNGSVIPTRTVAVCGTASDDLGILKVEVGPDNSNWSIANGTTSWSIEMALEEGINLIFAKVTDTAGNMATDMIVLTTDTIRPSVEISVPGAGTVLSNNEVIVEGMAMDNLDVVSVELSLDGIDWLLAKGTTAWNGTLIVSDGPSKIFAKATDAARNTFTVSVELIIDTVLPTITILSPTHGAKFPTYTVPFSGTAKDNLKVQKVEISNDGQHWKAMSGTTTWSGELALDLGANNIQVRATDIAGNTRTESMSVTIDAPPSLKIIEPTNGSRLPRGSHKVRGTVLDDIGIVKVEISTDGANWIVARGNSSWTGEIDLEPGQSTIFVRATDSGGNVKTGSVTITVEGASSSGLGMALGTGIVVLVLILAVVGYLMTRSRGGRDDEEGDEEILGDVDEEAVGEEE